VFVRDPVQFFIRADDKTQQAIWDAMQRDKQHLALAPAPKR
jgi:hypothetical protein